MADETSRTAILRRRALFVSSAVALACSHQSPPAEPRRTVAEVPSAEPAEAAPEPGPAAAPDAGAPSAAGPFEIPEGISATAREKYEALAAVVRASDQKLDELDALLRKECDLTSPACDATYRSMADKLLELSEIVSHAFVCEGSSPEARAFAERQSAEERRYQERRRRVVLAVQARATSPDAKERWKRHQEDAEQANPQPCLKFGCPDW